MGCGCVGRKKSRNEIESKTEADKREEDTDGATDFDANTNYEALSEGELVEKVRSTYKDFLECQGSEGTSFSRENFESRFTKYVTCERAYLKKLGIDHNDTKKVQSVLDPILKGAGTNSAAKAPGSGAAGAESTPIVGDISIAVGEKQEEKEVFDNDVVNAGISSIEQELAAGSTSTASTEDEAGVGRSAFLSKSNGANLWENFREKLGWCYGGNAASREDEEVSDIWRDLSESRRRKRLGHLVSGVGVTVGQDAAHQPLRGEEAGIDGVDTDILNNAADTRNGTVDTCISPAELESADSSGTSSVKGRLYQSIYRITYWMICRTSGGIMPPEALKTRTDKIMNKYFRRGSSTEPELSAGSVCTVNGTDARMGVDNFGCFYRGEIELSPSYDVYAGDELSPLPGNGAKRRALVSSVVNLWENFGKKLIGATEGKKEEVGIQGDVAVSASNELGTLPEDGVDAHIMVTYSSESVSEQRVCSVLDSNLQEAEIDNVDMSRSCSTLSLGFHDEKTPEQELERRVLGAYKDFLECQRLEETSFSRENFESKFTEYLAYEHAYLEKLGKKARSTLDEILKEERIGSVDISPIETELLACRVSSPSMGGGAGVERSVLHLMMLNLWEDFLKNFPIVSAAQLLRSVKRDTLPPLNSEFVSSIADIQEESKSVGVTQLEPGANSCAVAGPRKESSSAGLAKSGRKASSHSTKSLAGVGVLDAAADPTSPGYSTDGTSYAPSTELSSVTASPHSSGQGCTRGGGIPHRCRVEVRYWCDDYRKSSL